MNLDLDELLGGWQCADDELSARHVRGEDGADLVQLRVDLGVLQMVLDGRPDGQRYRGLPTVYAYFQHEAQVGRDPSVDDWQELRREFQQYNYRRLALSSLADTALQDDDAEGGCSCLRRALRDIDRCLAILARLQENGDEWDGSLAMMLPTLVFNRARLRARLRGAEKRFDEAIEEAEKGARELGTLLIETGFDDEQTEPNPAVDYLLQLSSRLRERHGIVQTLREQLQEAVEREDFETAARLRDELRYRQRNELQPESSAPEDG
jgi:hypothetical protein